MFDEFIKEYQKVICGETETIKSLLLILSSKWVKNKDPLSFHTLLNSESGAGKDFILNAVFSLLDDKSFVSFTRISARALDYLDPKDLYGDHPLSWDHKFLGLEDIESTVLNSSTLKVFLSNGSKTAIVVDGKVVTTKHKGSPILVMTSAYSDPNKELMRRINILNLDESDDQTRNILLLQSKINKLTIDYERLRGIIKGFKSYSVRIPFSNNIAKLLSSKGTHMRTFFPRFLDFIKASAVFNQNDRVIKNKLLYASEQDYDIVKNMFENLSLTVSFNPLSKRKKEMLDTLIYEFEGGWFSVEDARKVLGLSYQGVFWRIKQFMKDDILESKVEHNEYSNKPIYYYRPMEQQKLKLPTFKEVIENE